MTTGPIQIPQPIPGEICLACDTCCRFPERESFLSPFFTEDEMKRAQRSRSRGVAFRPVPPSGGGQLIPVPWERGFRCPFFEPESHLCRIYRERPLDCRLYPYALMLDPDGGGVWLGIDTKCPAADVPDVMERLVTAATAIWEAAASSDLTEILEESPRLIGPYQPDVLPLFRLEEVTAALLVAGRLVFWKVPNDASSAHPRREGAALYDAPVERVRPLTLADRALVERYLRLKEPRLAGQSFALQFLAGDLLSTAWCEVDGFLCLWAFDRETVYMPLPPLGRGDFRRVLDRCFAFMDHHNRNPEISRIECLSLSDFPGGLLSGFHLRPGYPDYVYKRKELVSLRGRAYRSKRSDCLAFARNRDIEYRSYRPSDKSACLDLFERWQAQKMTRTSDPVARNLLEESRCLHLRALSQTQAIGLTGRVLEVRGRVAAYTFGFPLNRETFVVALEVTDPTLRGASAYIFSEFSKELEGYLYINAMDDSGLPGLRRLKRSYRPWRLEPSFTLYRR